VRRRQSRLS